MIALPRREATWRSADERAARAALLRQVLGPVEGWTEDARVELLERLAIADDVPESEVIGFVRADLLRRAR